MLNHALYVVRSDLLDEFLPLHGVYINIYPSMCTDQLLNIIINDYDDYEYDYGTIAGYQY